MAERSKSFSLARAGHLLSDERESTYVGAVIAAWAGHTIDVGAPASGRP